MRSLKIFGLLLLAIVGPHETEAGVIKDLFQKVTGSNNKTESNVSESAPICGSGIFSTPDEKSLSPEVIFISNRASTSQKASQERRRENQNNRNTNNSNGNRIKEVAKEFRFHVENVTLDQLYEHGFNRDAPITFLMHGFTSGYPLQAWITAIVEAYTIDRQSSNSHAGDSSNQYGGDNQERRRESSSYSDQPVDHNLFIINWNYAARGIVYPRAVANIPIVASYVTRFINEKLIDETQVDPRRTTLIGHSLGAHLAGFIGKNTKQKVGRIYGLDPAGPCFGAVSGPLYPSSKRLAPGDAEEVVTIQTNSALLGIDKPLGKYSIFVEGGAVQPGCKGGSVLKSISTLTFDNGDFDSVACSHSRAPNLMTYRYDQSDSQDDCQMVAYECKDWKSFTEGHCGLCSAQSRHKRSESSYSDQTAGPLKNVDCYRMGLDWQYPGEQSSLQSMFSPHSTMNHNHNHNHNDNENSGRNQPSYHKYENGSRRPYQRNRRVSNNSSTTERRRQDESVPAKSMFIRTGDTQPYCTYHYQIVLSLNEPFSGKRPMSIIMQDSEPESSRNRGTSRRREQNSLSSDEFGYRYDDKTYTHLLTSSRKLNKVDHATLLFRNGLPQGERILKELHINYMSHSDPRVRKRLSSHLCLIRNRNVDTEGDSTAIRDTRYHFEPCSQHSHKQLDDDHRNHGDDQSEGHRNHSSQNHRHSDHASHSYDNQSGSGSSNYGNQGSQGYSSSSYNRKPKKNDDSYNRDSD